MSFSDFLDVCSAREGDTSRTAQARACVARIVEAMSAENRKSVGSRILGQPYRLNVASISTSQAVDYANGAFAEAGAYLSSEIPNFKANFKALKSKMRHALNIPRIEMPVIEPADIGKFEKDLKSGRVDVFKPYAMSELGGGKFPWYPKLRGGADGDEWLRLGFVDGDKKDDIVVPKPGMVPVKSLKPLQGEIWFDKLVGSLLKFGIPEPGGFLLTNATIIVSKEGYILDGHHRFGQAMLADPSLKIKALRVPLPIDLLLKVGRSYGSAIGNTPKESVDESPVPFSTRLKARRPGGVTGRKSTMSRAARQKAALKAAKAKSPAQRRRAAKKAAITRSKNPPGRRGGNRQATRGVRLRRKR